jgi:hypothetical protein
MRQVYSPANAVEAHMLAHLLEQHDIPAHIHGEALQSGAGELPVSGLLQILVADEHYAHARELILAWEKQSAPSDPETPARPAIPLLVGLLIFTLGLLGGWALRTAALANAVPIDIAEEGLDQNGDGRDDITYFYRAGARLAYRAEGDRNFDGATDFIDRFDADGLMTRREADDNFDGFTESETTYRAGNPVRTEIDRNRNGVTDETIFYRHGAVERIEIMSPAGRVARVEYYADLRLARSESDLDGDGFLETVRTYDALGEISATETRQPG